MGGHSGARLQAQAGLHGLARHSVMSIIQVSALCRRDITVYACTRVHVHACALLCLLAWRLNEALPVFVVVDVVGVAVLSNVYTPGLLSLPRRRVRHSQTNACAGWV